MFPSRFWEQCHCVSRPKAFWCSTPKLSPRTWGLSRKFMSEDSRLNTLSQMPQQSLVEILSAAVRPQTSNLDFCRSANKAHHSRLSMPELVPQAAKRMNPRHFRRHRHHGRQQSWCRRISECREGSPESPGYRPGQTTTRHNRGSQRSY